MVHAVCASRWSVNILGIHETRFSQIVLDGHCLVVGVVCVGGDGLRQVAHSLGQRGRQLNVVVSYETAVIGVGFSQVVVSRNRYE